MRSDRRSPYFSAWMMSRKRPVVFSDGARSVDASLDDRSTASTGIGDEGCGDWLSLASGSPQPSHTGGVMSRTADQQVLHTQPDSGSSRMASHTAQAGASRAATRPLAACLMAPETLGIRGWGLGIGSITGVTLFE